MTTQEDQTMQFPTIADVIGILASVRADLVRWGIDDTDVRLQVTSSGWRVHTGASDYDQDHRGHWGASSVAALDDARALRFVASDLLEQVAESLAMEAV